MLKHDRRMEVIRPADNTTLVHEFLDTRTTQSITLRHPLWISVERTAATIRLVCFE